MLDCLDLKMQGIVEFYVRGENDNGPRFESRHNIIVSNARKIIRDLVYGKKVTYNAEGANIETSPAPNLKYLILGDMNLTLEEAQKGVREASVNDVVMVNPTAYIPLKADSIYTNNKIEAVQYLSRDAIKFTIEIPRECANTNSGFFTEIGLATDYVENADSYLFTKLNRSPIVKSNTDQIIIVYYLLF